ncbi:hypothetical protein [Vibrio vulnificus]|uniref:hypothetical protein n=1 Tax=Vibrio vulnificus TaxID=672 RepID=UPI001FB034C8|nr:hypothetical protein [Vibrio vulnificus]MCJ0803025.1 hypothetical protein [Vibrio vulnificus]
MQDKNLFDYPTQEQVNRFLDEVREVCAKHGMVIYGTCERESIYGEICIDFEGSEPQGRDKRNEEVERDEHGYSSVQIIKGKHNE